MTEKTKGGAWLVPVAGGKGGIGKSCFTSNLGQALASLGFRTVIVDLDLGNANLHTLLCVPNIHPGVGDFLKAGRKSLSELIVETPFDGLGFLPGDGRMPFMANLPHVLKIKLVTHLQLIEADFVIFDLGAGSSFNTLDLFSASPHGIVLTTPELPAVMSLLVFLKNFMMRSIDRSFSPKSLQRKRLKELFERPIEADQLTVDLIRNELGDIDSSAAEKVDRIVHHFRPRLVLSMTNSIQELDLLGQVQKSLKKVLELDSYALGMVPRDPSLLQAILDGKPYFPNFSTQPAGRAYSDLAERVAANHSISSVNGIEALESLRLMKERVRSKGLI